MDNLTALANIAANLAEIAGIAGGGVSTSFFWLPLVMRVPGYAKNMLIFGPIMVISGLVVPGVTSLAAEVHPLLAVIVGWALGLPLLYFGVRAFFLPCRISSHSPQFGFITFLNIALFIPFAWAIALGWALYLKKKELIDSLAPAFAPDAAA